MKKILYVTAISSIIFLTGCASIAGDNTKTVQVNSYPRAAQVYANNTPVGITPVLVSVPSTWSPTLLTFKKKGYADQTAQINTTFQPIGILNILFWPGFIVDAISGNTMKIAPESRTISVNLSKPV